jgi:hypothetical protein
MASDMDIVRSVLAGDFVGQFERYLTIQRKDGYLETGAKANIHQRRIAEARRICRELGIPCRIIALKPRQKGSSTGSVGIGYVDLKERPKRGLIAGGAHFQGQNLFKILSTYAKHDRLDPAACKVMDMEGRFRNGSTMERITLATASPGRSGTYQFLLVTEAALLAREGVANADNVLDGLLKCVGFEDGTVIILESTAYGANGYFYDVWQGGITLDQLKAGANGYCRIFSAWYEFEDSRLDPATEGIASWDDLRADEQAYVDDVGSRLGVMLELDQVAWMRWALRDECKGDWDKFKQDYPSDPDTAFLRSGRCVFEQSGITYQESLVRIRPREFGSLNHDEKSDRVMFVPCREEQARCVRWEQPRVGCRYLVSIDPMTGADQTGGDDPDSHSVLVHRAGYVDHRGQWIEPALVMRNMMVPGHKPGSLCCWWNIDVLEEEVYRMARYYNAIIAPEMNMDRGLVELLKLRPDAHIFVRPMFNRREQVETNALGWVTDKTTRAMILEKLIGEIREAGRGNIGRGYEVRCPWIIAQMKNFGTKPSGKMEALTGHDDDILSLAIGITLMDSATTYSEPKREAWLPPDLRREIANASTGRGRGTFS